MQKWEYKTISGWSDEWELNKLGKEGWELVSVAVENSTYGMQSVRVYLKRRISD